MIYEEMSQNIEVQFSTLDTPKSNNWVGNALDYLTI
jgi:hypothetical protein